MRVLILSQYYAPEPIPKPVELAQSLRARGHDVVVVTGIPNYPSGRLYPGYRVRPLRREVVGGVPVIRTFEYPYHGLRATGRFLNYASFMLSAPLAAALTGPVDVIYVWHPPLTVGVAAWLIGLLRRAPFVYDVQDIWPDAAVEAGAIASRRVTRLLHRLETFVYRRAARVITVTSGAQSNLIEKGVPAGKLAVLPHWIDVSAWAGQADADRARTRATLGWTGKFVAMFAGNVGVLQALDGLVEAMAVLGPDEPFRLVIVGDGADLARVKARAAALGVGDRVEFFDHRPAAEMPTLLAAADALVVHLKRSRLAEWSVPTKILAYLSAGRPILAATEGPGVELVERAGAGVSAPPQDPAGIASALRQLAALDEPAREAMGARGRQFAETHLSRECVIPQYEALLSEAALVRRGAHV